MSGVDTPSDDVTVLAAGAAADLPPVRIPEGAVPTWVDYDSVVADLADDGVSAPTEYVEGLRGVVTDARDHGVDLRIVYTERPASVYTQARDLAVQLATTCDRCTVLVRTPAFAGSESDTVPRARLEAGQDDAYRLADPVLSAAAFERKIVQPGPSWGVVTTTFLLALVVAVAVLVVLVRRRRG